MEVCMKTIVRNISVGLIIVSYFLPWFNPLVQKINGLQFIMIISGFGPEIYEGKLTFIGIVVSSMFILAIVSLFKTHIIPLILLLIVSTVLMAVFFLPEMSFIRETGVYITLLGVIGCFLSLFLCYYFPNISLYHSHIIYIIV